MRDGDGRRIPGTAVGVAAGRIVAIGSSSAVRRRLGAAAQRLAFGGATLLPGAVDPHVHLFGMATREVELDAGRVPSLAALLRAVRTAAARAPAAAWVRGVGLDERRIGRLPTAAELEGAAPGRAVRLRHRSRHASVLSETAVRRLVGSVPASAIGRNGLVVGREPEISRLVGPLGGEALTIGFDRVGAALVRQGVTCVGDASPRSRRAWEPLIARMRAGTFAPRVVAMGPPRSAGWPPIARLCYGGVKIVVEDDGDGMRPGPATLQRLVAEAAGRGHRVAVHCVSAATLLAALDAFGRLPAGVRRGRGHRLEHVGECPPHLVGEIARLGLVVVSNPAFVHWRGDAYLAEESVPASWLYRLRSLTAAGILVAGASDAPVVPCDPWRTIAAARTRRTAGGRPLAAGERVGARAAVALVCRSAARAAGKPELGRLAPGGVADLVVVDRDPVRTPADHLPDTSVVLTMIDGEPVWRA